jgi:hypothetical protein
MEQWEYLTTFLEADRSQVDMVDVLGDLEADETPVYSPEAMMPDMNKLGAKGWELVHMQPVYVGKNNDIMLHEGGGTRRWTNKYFCVFKRKV